MKKQIGIVLKTYFPKKVKIILLDQQWGKIEGVPGHTDIFNGAVIEYYPQSHRSLFLLKEVSLVDMPLLLAQQDILFLHHILEICYFCIPFGVPVPEIFDMMQALYKQGSIDFHFKIAFIFKLLVTLGIYPHAPHFQRDYFYYLAVESIDTILDKSIDLEVQQHLHEWINASMSEHPLIHHFRTMRFLYDRAS